MSLPNMDQPSRNFYQILEVDRDASNIEIKRKYRDLALKYHPDKNPDPNVAEKFKDIVDAYEVLSDPQLRPIYDRYGEYGISMYKVAPFLVEPKKLLSSIFGVTSLFILFILFLSFLCIRVDGIVSWNWALVFIPLWILDAVVIAVSFLGALFAGSGEDDEEEEDVNEVEETEEEKSKRKEKRKRLEKRAAYMAFAITVLFTLFQIFIVLHLESGWDIFVTFIPYFIMEFIFFALNIFLCYHAIKALSSSPEFAAEPRQDKTKKYLWIVYETFATQIVRFLQVILIILKINKTITSSWGIIFIPTFVYGASTVILLITLQLLARFVPSLSDPSRKPTLLRELAVFIFQLIFFYLPLALIIAKLEGSNISLAVSIIPIWIALSLITCCLGICLPISILVAPPEEMSNMMGQVHHDRLICWKDEELGEIRSDRNDDRAIGDRLGIQEINLDTKTHEGRPSEENLLGR
ncbi:hypothetical protein BKA69DRAFT_1098623 [Paraphysoderma sedebokerense]|nr:hypothetical protein BKA69DRAFT_1098623 [Paraphysoderma sedebokerense]